MNNELRLFKRGTSRSPHPWRRPRCVRPSRVTRVSAVQDWNCNHAPSNVRAGLPLRRSRLCRARKKSRLWNALRTVPGQSLQAHFLPNCDVLQSCYKTSASRRHRTPLRFEFLSAFRSCATMRSDANPRFRPPIIAYKPRRDANKTTVTQSHVRQKCETTRMALKSEPLSQTQNHFCVVVTHRARSLPTLVPMSLGPPARELHWGGDLRSG
jgi:hypothetical protein